MRYIIATLDPNDEIEILKQTKDKTEALIYGENIAFSAYIDIAIYEMTGTMDSMGWNLISRITP